MRGTIGLDFGTSNTVCAWVDGDQAVVIPNRRGERTSPTLIAKTGTGEILTGSDAEDHALVEPFSVFRDLKKNLGKAEKIILGNTEIDTIEACAMFFRAIKSEAEEYSGFNIHRAVLSVPARFADSQRRAIKKAAENAGLEVIRIINEPSAAALARAVLLKNKEKTPECGLTLVINFGADSFDVSVLKLSNGQYRVISSEGEESQGGSNIDKALFQYVSSFVKEKYGIDPKSDAVLTRVLLNRCEKIKIELSNNDAANLTIPFLNEPKGLGQPGISINRKTYDSIISPIIDKNIALVNKVLEDCKLSPGDIDFLILAGGSCHIPLVRNKLQALLNLKAEQTINPEEIVALGAAIEAARIDGQYSGLSFVDVCSRSFGLELDDGTFFSLINKNDTLPAKAKKIFTTVEDYQQSVELHIMQAESSTMSEKAVSVGRFLLPGIRYAKMGEPRIAVEFTIDESDMLFVKAMDLDTKVEQSVILLGGTMEDYPIKYRLNFLAKTAIIKAEGLVLDAALAAELKELTEKALLTSSDDTLAESLIFLLEGLIAELTSRRIDLDDQKKKTVYISQG